MNVLPTGPERQRPGSNRNGATAMEVDCRAGRNPKRSARRNRCLPSSIAKGVGTQFFRRKRWIYQCLRHGFLVRLPQSAQRRALAWGRLHRCGAGVRNRRTSRPKKRRDGTRAPEKETASTTRTRRSGCATATPVKRPARPGSAAARVQASRSCHRMPESRTAPLHPVALLADRTLQRNEGLACSRHRAYGRKRDCIARTNLSDPAAGPIQQLLKQSRSRRVS
jgi:hypothetical protein